MQKYEGSDVMSLAAAQGQAQRPASAATLTSAG